MSGSADNDKNFFFLVAESTHFVNAGGLILNEMETVEK
jgi:hypothetical protein